MYQNQNNDTTYSNTRPRRVNAGAGVERIHMDFVGKGYGAKREFNFVTNGEKTKREVKKTIYPRI